MISISYAILKKAAAIVNHDGKRLGDLQHELIVRTCDEILAGQHHDMFPLHVWMTGSGTQFNMNVNEVISNRCCQLADTPLGSKAPVHPNDHVNMSQSSNDSFPSAMYKRGRSGRVGGKAAADVQMRLWLGDGFAGLVEASAGRGRIPARLARPARAESAAGPRLTGSGGLHESHRLRPGRRADSRRALSGRSVLACRQSDRGPVARLPLRSIPSPSTSYEETYR
jgi:hypothetical protein